MRTFFVSFITLLAVAGCSNTQSSSHAQVKDSVAPSALPMWTCDNAGYFGGYITKVYAGSEENHVKISVEKVAGPDGDGERMAEQLFDGERLNDSCELYGFSMGYLKICSADEADLYLSGQEKSLKMICTHN